MVRKAKVLKDDILGQDGRNSSLFSGIGPLSLIIFSGRASKNGLRVREISWFRCHRARLADTAVVLWVGRLGRESTTLRPGVFLPKLRDGVFLVAGIPPIPSTVRDTHAPCMGYACPTLTLPPKVAPAMCVSYRAILAAL